jgi:hypothetical protein
MFLNVRVMFYIVAVQVVDNIDLFASSVNSGYTPYPRNILGYVVRTQEIKSPKKVLSLFSKKR